MKVFHLASDIVLEKGLRQSILTNNFFLNAQEQCLQALSVFFQIPIISTVELSKRTGKSYNTANHIIARFLDFGVLEEMGTQKRNKLFRFSPYIKLLENEYEPSVST